tara:strand:- start:45 stop:248 length:204 start_codon:yes stop_codon:yes gene_type:complete
LVGDPEGFEALSLPWVMLLPIDGALAALKAVVELTGNPAIIPYAMLVIVIANLTASHIFDIRSIFQM